jgi:hypothetical protein
MGGATWARGAEGGAVAGAAGDVRDARGVEGFGEGHGRQEGGQPARQPRLPCPGGAEQDVVVTMPASCSPLHLRLEQISTGDDGGR